MRASGGLPAGLAAVALGVVAGGVLVACFDLLHSTSDVLTACEIDAAQPGCSHVERVDAGDGGGDGGQATDFCRWSPAEADQHATHACAWLGACESPMGRNAFGPCVFRARMAYDCAANPGHRPRGTELALWDCLQRAQSCGDVDTCVFSSLRPLCNGAGLYTACLTLEGAPDVRVACADAGAEAFTQGSGENCALWGQTCAATDGGAECAGQAMEDQCQSECADQTALHWCTADDAGRTIDVGMDCAGNGAGVCGAFPSGTPGWVACTPEGDGGACDASASATCGNGLATMCPAGLVETLDCAALLGAPAACVAGALDPPFDWTSACAIGPGGCAGDSCDGGVLTSCERGAPFRVDCGSEQLGPCQLVQAEPATSPRAACKRPP